MPVDDSTEITHDAMNNCMFTKEDDFAWSADKPFAVVLGTSSTCLPKRKLLDGPANGVRNADIVVGGEGDRSGFKYCKLPKIGFVPESDRFAFGFLDPSVVIRGCHLIPAFAQGRTGRLLRANSTFARNPGEKKDWINYYVGM